MYDVRYHAAQHRYLAEADPEAKADIVVDNDDPRSPAIVRTASELERIAPHLRRTREFFAPRAASWDTRFPDDEPAYRRAVAELAPARGGTVIDLGCGTGRALRSSGRPSGPMASSWEWTRRRRCCERRPITDETSTPGSCSPTRTRLPVAPGRVDAIFAAGLLTHVPDPVELLRLLARASSPQARLALFHPIGRAALARRHHRTLRTDELLEPRVLTGVLEAAGGGSNRSTTAPAATSRSRTRQPDTLGRSGPGGQLYPN